MRRWSLRRQMAAVAVVAVALAAGIGAVRLAHDLKFATLGYGWNTSVFPVGHPVEICRDATAKDGASLTAGTRGVVVGDRVDEDSAHPDRLISVKLADGPHRGTTKDVERRDLRR